MYNYLSKYFRNTRAQMGGAVMAVIFAIILLVAVAIPIATQVVADSNLTGITATIVQFLPVFLGLAALAVTASLVR